MGPGAGIEPVLILLDELPSYLQMAQGEPVGATTLGDLTIGALERLFNALPRCPRACVVVTNLKDDVYLDGSGQLRTLIESLTKHYDRNAQAITPVQQNSGEVFAIVRKRLFDSLPARRTYRRGRAGLCRGAPEGEARRHDPDDARDLRRAHPRDLSLPPLDPRHRRPLRREPRLPEDARPDSAAATRRARRPGRERQCVPGWPSAPRLQRPGDDRGDPQDQSGLRERDLPRRRGPGQCPCREDRRGGRQSARRRRSPRCCSCPRCPRQSHRCAA